MSKILLLSLLLVLSACNIGVTQNIAVPVEKRATTIEVPKTPPTPVVSSEVTGEDVGMDRLESEESKALIELLRIQGEKEVKKSENTGSLIVGDWKAVYTPPKYPDGLDSITVTMSGKTYTLPGVYGKKEREKYLAKIADAKNRVEGGCIDEEKYPDSIEIDGKYYRPPTSADCMFELSFGYFDSFSPSGYYLIYQVSGYERGETRVIDIESGKEVEFEDGKKGDKSHISWTPDRKQMLFVINQGMGDNGDSPGLYITKSGAFPNAEKISDFRDFISIESDNTAIYLLEDGIDLTLRILSRENFEEVYSRSVGKW